MPNSVSKNNISKLMIPANNPENVLLPSIDTKWIVN